MSSSISLVQHAEDAKFIQLTPNKPIHSPYCPSKMTKAYKTKEGEGDEKNEHHFTSACLAGKTVSYPLDYLHRDLEQTVNLIGSEKGPNVLAAKVSFVVKVESHVQVFDFGLKCINNKGQRYSLFSFDEMEKKYKSPKQMYACIGHFGHHGRERMKIPNNEKHGVCPNYKVNKNGKLKQGQAQSIKHTEQLMVAYLARPEAAVELIESLKEKIFIDYPKAKNVKIYSMGIHFHSIRICCSPCEYALSGLLVDKEGITINNELLGLFPNFVNQLPNKFYTSKKFRIISTGTSNLKTRDHKAPEFEKKKVDGEDDLSTDEIDFLAKKKRNLYQTFLNNPIEVASDFATSQQRKSKTLFISGTRTKKTTDKLKAVKEQEKL